MHAENRPGDSYFAAAQEDRCAPRTRIAIPATLRPSGGRGFQTVVRDISTAGFAASAICRMHAGTICWISLPGLESFQAEVMWWNNSVVGCGFSQMLSPLVVDNLILRWRNEGVFYPSC